MNVLVVEPGAIPYEKEISGIEEMEKTVRGHFDAIYPFEDYVAVVLNSNRENYRAEFNRSIPERQYGGIFGTFFVCGIEGEHFCSLTPEQMEKYKKRFEKAENLLAIDDRNQVFTQKVIAVSSLFPKPKPKRPPKKPKR